MFLESLSEVPIVGLKHMFDPFLLNTRFSILYLNRIPSPAPLGQLDTSTHSPKILSCPFCSLLSPHRTFSQGTNPPFRSRLSRWPNQLFHVKTMKVIFRFRLTQYVLLCRIRIFGLDFDFGRPSSSFPPPLSIWKKCIMARKRSVFTEESDYHYFFVDSFKCWESTSFL